MDWLSVVKTKTLSLSLSPSPPPTHIQQVDGETTRVTGELKGLTKGDHGFHIHEFGDLSAGCVSAGSHFNPTAKDHGGPADAERHAGDLGNIVAGEEGTVIVDITDAQIPLKGPDSIIGRSVVVRVVCVAVVYVTACRMCAWGAS